MDTTKIQRGFSRAAKGYDQLTGLHRQIADSLAARLSTERPDAILDVGCGTGYLTDRLQRQFPRAEVFGLDLAPGMLETARRKNENITWILGNSNRLPFSDGKFDMVVSNLAYQWSGDLTQAFDEVTRVLTPDGILACTLFGYQTCVELFQSLRQAAAGALQFTRLPDESKVREALDANKFQHVQIHRESAAIEFKDMQELLLWIKSIGANHLPREGFLGRDILSLAADIYRSQFPLRQGVAATFEVISVYAQK